MKNSLIGLGVGLMGVLIMCSCHRNKEIATANRPSPKPITQVTVCAQGSTNSVIVLSEKPTTSAQYAALELQYHLEKITGVKVPIVREPEKTLSSVQLAVGDTRIARELGFPVEGLAPWEFLIAEKNGVIVLAGGDDPATGPADWEKTADVRLGKAVGTCYAVFEFLENYCGVHWYLPSEAGMVFPTVKTLVVQMGAPIRRKTDFRSTSFGPPYFNKKMYWLPGSETLAWKDILSTSEFFRWQFRNKVGGEPYGPSHSFGDWINRFGSTHPDWFSYKTKEKVDPILAKGVKEAEDKFQYSGQPCLTAPGVLEQVVTDARDFFENGNTKQRYYNGSQGRFFGIGLNDQTEMCQCPACKALYGKPTVIPGNGSASFYLWNFVNHAAREIRNTHPDKWMAVLAYMNYTVPPADFTLEPNVAVTICNMGGNWTPALREQSYRLISAWRNGAKAQWIGLWEYFCFQRQITGVPRVAPRLLGEDVKKVCQIGVVAEYMEGEAYGAETTEAVKNVYPSVWVGPIRNYLNVWIRFKLWDDTRRDVGKLLDEHYRLFYGPAAGPVQRFYGLLEDRVTNMSLRGPETFTHERSANPKIDWEYLCPPETMKELRRSIDEATRCATAEPYKTRVAWVRAGIMEAMEKEQARYMEEKKNTPPLKRMETVCYFMKTAPVIDGDGGDPTWKALPIGFLREYKAGAQPKVETTFRMGYDRENLYVLCECDDPDVKHLRTIHGPDTEVWTDDCVELFLCFDPEKKQAAHMIVNAAGAVWDAMCREDVDDVNWNSGMVAKTRIHDRGYTVEMKIPLKAVGCSSATSGLRFFGNLCREKYSGSPNSSPDALLSWSPAPEGFVDRGAFGQILLTEGDAWHVFFSRESLTPAATLYAINPNDKWTPVPDGIKAMAEPDHIRFEMNCSDGRADIRRITGTISINLDQPVDVSKYPYAEIRFYNEHKDLLLELGYDYVGEDGTQSSNFFFFSLKDNAKPVAQTFIWDINKGNYLNRPQPKLLNRIRISATHDVMSNEKAVKRDFALYSIRFCKETSRGITPELIPVASGMH